MHVNCWLSVLRWSHDSRGGCREENRSAGYWSFQHGRFGLSLRELFSTQEPFPCQEKITEPFGTWCLLRKQDQQRNGSVRSVSSGVHPGLLRPDGCRLMQRRCRESHPQKQSEFSGATAAFLPAHFWRYWLSFTAGFIVVWDSMGWFRGEIA